MSRRGSAGLGLAVGPLNEAGIEIVEVSCARAQDLAPCIMMHRDAIDCVILGGGDGTVQAAGEALVRTGLPLGLLPLGTANDFARSMRIPFDIKAAARVIAGGRTCRIDVGDVNGRIFFNVASVGIAADLAKSLTTERKRRFGRLSYALTAGRLLLQTGPFHATLIMGRRHGNPEDGNPQNGADHPVMVRTLQVTIGNGRYYGGGNVVAEDAHINDGYLHLYSLEFPQVWRMALMIPSFPKGAHGGLPGVRTARCETVEIVTRRPRPVNADGELITTTPALFSQRRQAVSVYVPGDGPTVPAGARA